MKSTLITLIVAVLGSVLTQAQTKPVEHYRDLKYPPPGKLQPPKPERSVLPNGLTVYLIQDHELPMVNVSALIRIGSRWEPVAKAGLASLVGTVMRTGGSLERNGDKLDDQLDALGATIEISVTEDSATASVSVLKEDIGEAMAILADLLQHPAFPQNKIDLAMIEQRDNVARRNDMAMMIAYREFPRILLGPNSAYGHQIEYATLDAITRDDLVVFHRDFFQPENVILGVWGDFGSELKPSIEKLFGAWPRGNRPKPPVPPVQTSPEKCAGYYLINKDDVNQSWVFMGHLVGRRDDPDYYAQDLMNQVLGTSFASRLFSNVRSAQGLAYTVGSDWAAGWDRPGTFMAQGSTKTESTAQILTSIRTEIAKVIEGGITDAELSRVKEATAKKLAFEFDSTGKIVQRLMQYEYYGYPADYLERYQENIAKVTREDVARVAKQYLKPDQFAVLVVGNPKGFDRPLSQFGRVTEVDISIPGKK